MKIEKLMNLKENEKPLDNIVLDGGYTSIFRNVACIGDSLSSGEFEAVDENEVRSYHDLFEYSWGQFMARMIGAKVYNFSRGGMTAKEYMETFAEENDYFNPEYKSEAYIIALGVNDLFGRQQQLGSINDIDLNDYNNNKDTFAGWYARIIQKYKQIQPKAKFFFVTMPREKDCNVKAKEEHANLLYNFTKIFDYSYVIDLNKYAPVYDEEFKRKFYLHGHLNPAGYKLTANMITSYIDYIIRNDFESFKQVGFIGKSQYDERLEK